VSRFRLAFINLQRLQDGVDSMADGAGPSNAGGPAGAGGPDAGAGGDGATRASTRVRKVAKALARVDDDVRRQAVAARLDALECDNAAAEPGDDDSDDYVAADDMEGASVCSWLVGVKHCPHSFALTLLKPTRPHLPP
jgi:hypothetical protein